MDFLLFVKRIEVGKLNQSCQNLAIINPNLIDLWLGLEPSILISLNVISRAKKLV